MHHLKRLACAALCTLSLGLQAGNKLSRAVIGGKLEEIKACLTGKEQVNDIDKWGWTPLHWAVYNHYDAIAKWLIAQGADPNLQSTRVYKSFPTGITPLWLAGYYGQDDLATILLAAKANPGIKDSNGSSPRDIALSFEFQSCADLMDGKTPVPKTQIVGKVTDLYVFISSPGSKAKGLLESMKTALDMELTERKIRHLVQVEDTLALDDAEAKAQVAAFKPKYVMIWNPHAAASAVLGVGIARAHARLSLAGDDKPLWEKDTESRKRPYLDRDGDWEAAKRAVQSLMTEMEGDSLF